MPRYRHLCARATQVLTIIAVLLISSLCTTLLATAADVASQGEPNKPAYLLDFSSYAGGSVDDWLKGQGFKFERDAKNRNLLGLSITDHILNFDAKGRMIGLILNDSVNVKDAKLIKINWGIRRYPKEVSYNSQTNNEALMIYIFFGKEKLPSGHVLLPNGPYFIGLFLCQDERVLFPYKGRYFHEGGRFVCLGKPQPNETIASEFDLDEAFKSYFNKGDTPGITGIGFGVDTSKSGDGGKAGAFIKTIQIIDRNGTKTH
jgi:hypothetical protein